MVKKPTGSQKEAIVTPPAKTDIQRQGKKYGNLHHKLTIQKVIVLQTTSGEMKNNNAS